MTPIRLLLFALAALAVSPLQAQSYEPNWESLDSRPTPAWFEDAKLGIFIHWGVYSVPAFAPKEMYAEWYWWHLRKENRPETVAFHLDHYGTETLYTDFADDFTADMFDPAAWADLFDKAGARYVVLTSKHHDGFALWPSEYSWNWNAVDAGPHRDLAGDLTAAVRERGLRMGFYYSLWEWFNPLYMNNLDGYTRDKMLPEMKDLVTRYEPDILWGDGEWRHTAEDWRSLEFLAWLFNDSPVADTIAVNDRWGMHLRGKHGGYYTTEYGRVYGDAEDVAYDHPWEECRGIGHSFGFNRNEDAWDYLGDEELIELFIDIVSRGGNLLLNVGPTADGRIPPIQQDRLLALGDWLDRNGEAIYGTRAWRARGDGDHVRYTEKDGAVYAILLQWPGDELTLAEPNFTEGASATLLGVDLDLQLTPSADGATIQLPPFDPQAFGPHAWAIRLEGVE